MNVLLVSQCNKAALTETRRIIDQFAERRGDRVWQTEITQQGLDTLRTLLKKTARRNTAVACHWIRGKDHSELIWIVGNIKKFNEKGAVPTNTTERDVLRNQDENDWHTAEDIALLASLAGLFHDFGKANKLFQEKLKPNAKRKSEPCRHEWVSLRLFQAFVSDKTDSQWLEQLARVSPEHEKEMMGNVYQDALKKTNNPFKKMPPLARCVGWLIVSHHFLPKYPVLPKYRAGVDELNFEPKLKKIDCWMTSKGFNATWNSPQADDPSWTDKERQQNWRFQYGTPLRSASWCDKARSIGKRALARANLFSPDWIEDRFSLHLARMSLMLADHCYSAQEPTRKWQDNRYKAYANTDRETHSLKQRLDEHNIGVGINALLIAKRLPSLRQSLPAISRHKGFKKRASNGKFRWQDKSYELAKSINARAHRQGFFGVNMASTGCGKTFANARIMYGLADQRLGCRFSVALGLRTLTLQTGDALRQRLKLSNDDLAVLIGSQSIAQLHQARQQEKNIKDPSSVFTSEQSGSESAAPIFEEHQYVRYEGSLDDGRLSSWLKRSPKLHQLLSAPVLVSTIDHLIPATEGERGGKQIAPMLRLLTSDLVLDEPDDFELSDLPALSRLVNWAGVYGARVLLSSATLPPALVEALFESYLEGRKSYDQCRGGGESQSVCCAWFDEFGVLQNDHSERQSYASQHNQFVEQRIQHLNAETPLRTGQLVKVNSAGPEQDVIDNIAQTFYQGLHHLHEIHGQSHAQSGKRISIGLIRMANINPLVAVAQRLLAQPAQANHRIYFCIYHSQHPLVVRSNMEYVLDKTLDRHDPEALWNLPWVKDTLQSNHEDNHIFLVFATAVAEVGRDHDYDWAIVEPSSMRSIIQLAGRVQRHRQIPPHQANVYILNKNYKALKGVDIAYTRPGFESEEFQLEEKDLSEILEPAQYQSIGAGPRIKPRHTLDYRHNLVDLEHEHLRAKLFYSVDRGIVSANLWWQHRAHWCAELQRRSRFRNSVPDERFVFYIEEAGEKPLIHQLDDDGQLRPVEKWLFKRTELKLGAGMTPWVNNDVYQLIEEISEKLDLELVDASRKFAEFTLREVSEEDNWCYSALFGVYGAL